MISNMQFLVENPTAAKRKILHILYSIQQSWTAEIISDECFILR